MNSNLLEKLAKEYQSFISDFKYCQNPQFIKFILQNVTSITSFTIDDWNYSVFYIFGYSASFQSYEDIENFIKKIP